jgi:hypothetical protein
MAILPRATQSPEISNSLRELGRAWAISPSRPRIDTKALQAWKDLARAWASSSLPLVIRKSGLARGSVIRHESGRDLVIADNSPAQWAFNRAFGGAVYALADVISLMEMDQIPFTYIAKASEKPLMRYKCTLKAEDNINARGWKLCHIQEIGLGTRTPIERLEIGTLVNHFIRFVDPNNHFLVPLAWGGLGEVPEVIESIAGTAGDFPIGENRTAK